MTLQWASVGNLLGPQGIQGIQGPEGPEGPEGPSGITTKIGARIYRAATGASSAASGARALTDVFDTTTRNDGCTVTIGTGRIAVPIDGWYACVHKSFVAAGAAGLAEIWVNGSRRTKGNQGGTINDFIAVDILYLSSGDYVQGGLNTGTSVGVTGTADAAASFLSVVLVSESLVDGLIDHNASHFTGGADPLTPANIGAQPVDSDLTTIAGLTATTDNFMVAASSAWASRTPSQAKTALGLVKGDVGLGNVDNVQQQPIDADLTTIAGLTATTDSFLQAKSSAWAARTLTQVKADLGEDAAAGTTSLRTLGTGATQAAAGNHAHSGVGLLNKDWPALAGIPRTSAFPGIVQANGTNLPVPGYAFDAAAIESVFYFFRATPYSAGSLIVELDWYADTASTNSVVWGAQMAAITPDTDSQDVETDALPTVTTVTDAHLGTTGQRLHRAVITLSGAALDSVAQHDRCVLRISREATNGSDNMAGDAILVGVTIRE